MRKHISGFLRDFARSASRNRGSHQHRRPRHEAEFLADSGNLSVNLGPADEVALVDHDERSPARFLDEVGQPRVLCRGPVPGIDDQCHNICARQLVARHLRGHRLGQGVDGAAAPQPCCVHQHELAALP